jgi:hypothetical protein
MYPTTRCVNQAEVDAAAYLLHADSRRIEERLRDIWLAKYRAGAQRAVGQKTIREAVAAGVELWLCATERHDSRPLTRPPSLSASVSASRTKHAAEGSGGAISA